MRAVRRPIHLVSAGGNGQTFVSTKGTSTMQAHHIKSLQLVHDFKRKHILIGLNFSLFPLPNSSNTWGVKQHEISPDFRWNCNPSNAWKYLEKGPSSLQEPEQCRGHGIQQHRHTQSLAWEKLLVLIQRKCPNTRWCADLLKRGRRGGEEMMGEEGEEEFIHQVSLRAQYVLHCWAGRQSQTGWGLSQPNPTEGTGPGQGRLWAPPAGTPSLPGPVSPGCECWSPPETCTSAPEAHWWDLPHTARAAVGGGEKMKGSRLDGLMRRGEKKVRSQQQVVMMKRKERKHGPGNQVSR